jgi:hypothetical protein
MEGILDELGYMDSKPKRSRGRKAGLGCLGCIGILVMLFFAVPYFMGTERDEGGFYPPELRRLIIRGPQNDEECLGLARLIVERKDAPYHINMVATLNRSATIHSVELIVREMLTKAPTIEEFYQVSDILLGMDESIHKKAGQNQIDYPKEMAPLLANQKPPREQTQKAWENRIVYLKQKFEAGARK